MRKKRRKTENLCEILKYNPSSHSTWFLWTWSLYLSIKTVNKGKKNPDLGWIGKPQLRKIGSATQSHITLSKTFFFFLSKSYFFSHFVQQLVWLCYEACADQVSVLGAFQVLYKCQGFLQVLVPAKIRECVKEKELSTSFCQESSTLMCGLHTISENSLKWTGALTPGTGCSPPTPSNSIFKEPWGKDSESTMPLASSSSDTQSSWQRWMGMEKDLKARKFHECPCGPFLCRSHGRLDVLQIHLAFQLVSKSGLSLFRIKVTAFLVPFGKLYIGGHFVWMLLFFGVPLRLRRCFTVLHEKVVISSCHRWKFFFFFFF